MKRSGIFYVVLALLSISNFTYAQNQEAATNQEDVVLDYKSLTRIRYERAIRYNDRGEAKSALYDLTTLEPLNDTLMTNLAYLYFEARSYPSAVLVSQDVLLINPSNAGALEIAAISYENLGLKDKALENYERLYLVSDDDPQLLYTMVFLQYDLGQYEQCMTNIDILLAKEEMKEIKAVYNISEEEQKEFSAEVALINLKGMVYKSQGNTEEARKSFQQALAIAPDFPLSKNALAELDSGGGE